MGLASGVAVAQFGGVDNLPIGTARPVPASTDPETPCGAIV
jgi:hypothetical protein